MATVFKERAPSILSDQLLDGGLLIEILYREVTALQQVYGKKTYRKGNLGFVTEVGSLLHLKCLDDSGMKPKIESANNWKTLNLEYLEKSMSVNIKMLANANVPIKRGKSFIAELHMKNSGFGGTNEQSMLDALDNFNSSALRESGDIDSEAKQKFSNMDFKQISDQTSPETQNVNNEIWGDASAWKKEPETKTDTTDAFAAFNFDKAPGSDVEKSEDPFASFGSFDNNKAETQQTKADTDLFATFK